MLNFIVKLYNNLKPFIIFLAAVVLYKTRRAIGLSQKYFFRYVKVIGLLIYHRDALVILFKQL